MSLLLVLNFMTDLSLIDWCVCAAYLVVVFCLAIRSARGQQDNEDFFLGGRSMNWFVVGVSMFATSFSSISFLGLPQRGAYQDFSFYLTILFIPFVITPILWWIFVPMFVRLKVSSGYEYLGLRFGLPAQKIGSALYCIYALGWMGTMLYAVALTLQTVMGLTHAQYYFVLIGIGAFATVYTVMGGLKAVIWTDVLQALVLGGAIIAVMFLAVNRIDGSWSAFWSIASEHNKFKMFHLNANLLAPENFTGRNTVFTAAAFGLFMYLPGYAVSQNMIQRYVCAGSLAGGRRMVVLSAVINTALGLLFLLVGTALFAFYSQPGGAGLPAAGAKIAKEDQILPYFVSTQLPGVGLVGLILAGLFAAAMSTIDSGINGVTSVIVYDWLSGKGLPLRIGRILTSVLGIVVIGAAILVPVLGDTVFEIIGVIAGTSLGMLLAIYLLGMFMPHVNLPGVLTGLAVGLICLALVWIFTEIPRWWFGAFTIVPTFITGAIASLFFPKPPEYALAGTLFRGKKEQKI
ncbi:MAG: sodium/solute symporter [Sedimentisphaerales bacterium]|nr:sodium/solute symporter [Sedimentisphaerales bacterium]